MDRTALWDELARQLCVDGIRASTQAGSGHPTSSMSAAHLFAVLYADHLRYDVEDPGNRANDRLVLSKGHASPLLFSLLKAIGAIDDAQLMSFRRLGSPMQGHPVPLPDMPYVDVATGSLGQGLPIGLGMALAMKMDGIDARVKAIKNDIENAIKAMRPDNLAEATAYANFTNAIGALDRIGEQAAVRRHARVAGRRRQSA